MESSDDIADSCEATKPQEQPENHLRSLSVAADIGSEKKVLFNQIDTKMDTLEDKASHKVEILDFLVRNKQAHFKSQQRGDPDLSIDEKKVIAGNLFDNSPSGFLSRFGHLLSKTHLDYFHTFEYVTSEERDEVEYRLSYLGASSNKSSKIKTKNRRYDALQRMIQSGSYFSMEEMQARNPLLFEQLVGKYQTDEEKQPVQEGLPTDDAFPWMQHFAKQVEKERMEKLKEQQKLDEAGDEDSSDEAEKLFPKEDEVSQTSSNLWGEYRGKFETASSSQKKKKKSAKKKESSNFQNVSEEEKAFYLQEFQNAMYHSFLTGNDKDFDYSTVDNNSEYDCVDMRERDEQDQYFDEETPDSISQADDNMTESSQDELAEFCEAPPLNRIATVEVAMEEEEEDNTTISDRLEEDNTTISDQLTQNDVRSLKNFASSWADNHSLLKSERIQERTFNPMKVDELDTNVKSHLSLHKAPVKKNHKIKINLKTKEM